MKTKIWIVSVFSTATHHNCFLGAGSTRKDAIEDAGGKRALPRDADVSEWDVDEAADMFPMFEGEIRCL